MNAVAAEQVSALDAHAAETTQRLNELRASFHDDITAAMAGRQRSVRAVTTHQRHGPPVVQQSPAMAVHDALDQTIVARDLMAVLRESRCPLVANLRTKIAAAYVAQQMHALDDHVAEARAL